MIIEWQKLVSPLAFKWEIGKWAKAVKLGQNGNRNRREKDSQMTKWVFAIAHAFRGLLKRTYCIPDAVRNLLDLDWARFLKGCASRRIVIILYWAGNFESKTFRKFCQSTTTATALTALGIWWRKLCPKMLSANSGGRDESSRSHWRITGKRTLSVYVTLVVISSSRWLHFLIL